MPKFVGSSKYIVEVPLARRSDIKAQLDESQYPLASTEISTNQVTLTAGYIDIHKL